MREIKFRAWQHDEMLNQKLGGVYENPELMKG